MKKIDIPKLIFQALSVVLTLGLVFYLGFSIANQRGPLHTKIMEAKRGVNDAFQEVASTAIIMFGLDPVHFLQPARRPGAGVTINNADHGKDDLILLSGFFDKGNELRLIRRDGSIVARWPVSFSKIVTKTDKLANLPKTDWNVDTHGAVALPDGSVVFNFEYNGLVKLDRCGAVQWVLPEMTHHSVEQAEGGGFWVPGQTQYKWGDKSPYPDFFPPFAADSILKVSADGKIEKEISVPGLFYKNNLQALLTSTGDYIKYDTLWDEEIVHLNKIDELTSDLAADFPMLEAGDLLLSMRTFNLLMIVDPDDERVKWWRIGPWIRQHDPEFVPGGKLIVFNNNTLARLFSFIGHHNSPDIPWVSNIQAVDLESDEIKVLYGGTPDQQMLSVLRGKVDLTPAGHLFITESEGGRVLEVDKDGKKLWEYINRFDEKSVIEINEARLYGPDYFKDVDWSCQKANQ